MTTDSNSYKQGLDAIVLMRFGELVWAPSSLGIYTASLVVNGKSSNYQASFKVQVHPNGHITYTVNGNGTPFMLMEGSLGLAKYEEIHKAHQEKIAKEVIDGLNDPTRNSFVETPEHLGASYKYDIWLKEQEKALNKYLYSDPSPPWVKWTSNTGVTIGKK